MLSKLHKKESGFTLIELMIVIAIIGILAAIAVPMFLTYRQRAYDTSAKAVVHNLKADNSNLNADLGVYGHTTGVAEMLNAVDPIGANGGVVDDTFTVPAMVPAASVLTLGSRLVGTTNPIGLNPARTLDIGVSIGRNMSALVSSFVTLTNNSSFNAFGRAYKGEIAFAVDADVENVLFMTSNQLWPNTAGLGATPVAAALGDNITGAASGGVPTGVWTGANE